jgi:hypothetical protein
MNYYRRLSLLKLSNQAMWLSNKTAMSVLATRAMLLNLCCDTWLLILNGRTPSDELGEFICFSNGGRNVVDYIVGSIIVW